MNEFRLPFLSEDNNIMFGETGKNAFRWTAANIAPASASVCIRNASFDVASLGKVDEFTAEFIKNRLLKSGGGESSEDKYFSHFCHGLIRGSVSTRFRFVGFSLYSISVDRYV